MGENEYNIFCCDYTVEKTEEYLSTVVKEKYSQEQVRQILEALNKACCAHNNQFRCNDAPYFIHPMRVAIMLLKFDRNTISKVLIAALLHDTAEKTNITFAEIEEQFGAYVAKLIRSVTRKHNERQSPQEKAEAKCQNWLEVMSSSHEVRMIKACEDLDNMICWKSIPATAPCRKKVQRWLNEAEKMSLPLARITNLEVYNVMRQEYEYYVEHGYAYSADAP
ncbi:MAG TPA: HD domain-containing protein [Methylomirabilota bacterium]|nr:HD domain-containing protein [Methylomirabilota bacterium]